MPKVGLDHFLEANASTNDWTSPNSVLLDSPTIRYLVAVVGNLEPVETSNSVNSPTRRGLLSFRSKSRPFVNLAAKSWGTTRLLSAISLQLLFFFNLWWKKKVLLFHFSLFLLYVHFSYREIGSRLSGGWSNNLIFLFSKIVRNNAFYQSYEIFDIIQNFFCHK